MKIEFKKCKKCNKIIQLDEKNNTDLICCDQPMIKLVANSTEAAQEKHIPVYEKIGNKIIVNIAEVEHPMLEEHYIEWIMIKTNQGYQKKYLSYKDKPKAEFLVMDDEKIEEIYSFCNIHGLWMCKL